MRSHLETVSVGQRDGGAEGAGQLGGVGHGKERVGVPIRDGGRGPVLCAGDKSNGRILDEFRVKIKM